MEIPRIGYLCVTGERNVNTRGRFCTCNWSKTCFFMCNWSKICFCMSNWSKTCCSVCNWSKILLLSV